MALTQTQRGSSGAYTNSFTITAITGLAVGDTVELNLTAGNADTLAATSPVVDNLGNTYALDKNSLNPTSGERQSSLYRCSVTNAGSPTITVTYTSGQFPDTAWIGRVYSGLTSTPLDVTSSNNDGTSFNQTHDAGTTAATSQASELVILFGGSSGSASPTFAAGSGYGNGLEQKGFDAFTYAFMSDKTVAATGAQSGNFTSSSFVRGQAGIATYKLSTGPTAAQLAGIFRPTERPYIESYQVNAYE